MVEGITMPRAKKKEVLPVVDPLEDLRKELLLEIYNYHESSDKLAMAVDVFRADTEKLESLKTWRGFITYQWNQLRGKLGR
jgi:hypothetical protein